MHSDDTVFAFRDRSPAAAVHVLVCPRACVADVGRLSGPEGAALVARLVETGRALLRRLAPGCDHTFGFHVPPFTSVQHLHLHAHAGRWATPLHALKYTLVCGCVLHYEPAEAALARLGGAEDEEKAPG